MVPKSTHKEALRKNDIVWPMDLLPFGFVPARIVDDPKHRVKHEIQHKALDDRVEPLKIDELDLDATDGS
jgi:hypothetical protein